MIKLTNHLRTYFFGGQLIPERLPQPNLPEGGVAEIWEVRNDRATTGRLTNHALGGRTLHDLVTGDPEALVGGGWRDPQFPLRVKFLDASWRRAAGCASPPGSRSN